MKILIINRHPLDMVGGGEIQCDFLATHLTRRQHDVVYLAVYGQRARYDVDYPVQPISLKFRELRQVIIQHRPDLVYWRFSKFDFLRSALSIKSAGATLVFAACNVHDVTAWSHKINFPAQGVIPRLRRRYLMARELLSSRINHLGHYFVDGVIAQTEEQAGKLPVKREVVIRSLADERSVPFAWPNPFVVWVASLKPRKNLEAYLQLARQLEPLSIDCLIVGQIMNPRYAYLTEGHELPSNVRYLGQRSYQEVNGILRQAISLVHTTYGPEGFPNVFIQAWMQGTPTVSLYCDPDAIIQRERVGALSGDFPHLVKDVHAIAADPDMRAVMGQRARTVFDTYFNPERNIDQIERFFQEVCATHGNPK